MEAIVGDSEEEEEDDGMFEGDVDEDEELWEFQRNCVHLRVDTTSDGADDRWGAFLGRARRMGQREPVNAAIPDECIWEVGCKPGRETLVASRMFLDQQQKVPVMAYPSMPGRIFVQAPTRDVVSHLAESMDDLNSNVILPVPIENLHRIISAPAPDIKPQSWARVRSNVSGCRRYRGDVGLITEHLGELVLLLVPRLPVEFEAGRLIRPPQILVSPTKVQAIRGRTRLSVNNDGSFVYRQRLYSARGFLILKPSHADIVLGDNVLPSQTEFACFVESGLLDAATNASTRASLSRNNLVVGDRVKITGGDFRDLLGHIADILDDEYVMRFLP
ncbi:hypothetical protein CPB84DRAFT_1851577 [Gymnopilus junonius]|uniref:NGN domain-containing protein n=1 Tax=Gymnopilus junonius TaxID=109634 RepID=A0A9P5ND72_GYMJU|nr:hypothetical protein CPB84DRAFT_1851577 [Gymnopilus junonius]